MTIETIIASSRRDFSVIATLSDAYVPACDVWVGDYPYVDKRQFRRLASAKMKGKGEIKQQTEKRITTATNAESFDFFQRPFFGPTRERSIVGAASRRASSSSRASSRASSEAVANRRGNVGGSSRHDDENDPPREELTTELKGGDRGQTVVSTERNGNYAPRDAVVDTAHNEYSTHDDMNEQNPENEHTE